MKAPIGHLSMRSILPALVLVLSVFLGFLITRQVAAAVAFVVGVPILYVVARRPDLAACGLVVWLPFEGWILKWIPGGTSLVILGDVISLWLLTIVAAKYMGKRRRLRRDSGIRLLLLPISLYIFSYVASYLVNSISMIDAVYFLRVNVRFIPIAILAADPDYFPFVRRSLPLVALVILAGQSFIGLLQFTFGASVNAFFWPTGGFGTDSQILASIGDQVVAGTTGHYNIFGILTVLCVGIIVGKLIDGGWPVRYRQIAIGSIALGTSMILATQSRQSILIYGLCAGLSLFMTQRTRGGFRRAVAMASLSVVVLLVFVAFGQSFSGSIQRLVDLQSAAFSWNQPAQDRTYALQVVAVAVLRMSPIFGIGPGSLSNAFSGGVAPIGYSRLALDPTASDYIGDVGWVSLLVQLGIVGVVAVVSVLSLLVRAARHSTAGERITIMWVTLTIAIAMFASAPIIYKGPSSLFWLVVGVAAGILAIERRAST